MSLPFQPGYAAYTQGFGTAPAGVSFPIYVTAAPTSSFIQGPLGIFQPGQRAVWINTAVYELLGFTSAAGILSANWVEIASSSGDILAVLGTANQITATTVGGTATLSLPAAITAPGSLATTTTLTAGTGLTVTSGGAAITGTTTINTSGSAVTTIGTGGTGATNIGNATGNTAVTGTLTTSGAITATTGNITASAGNLVATLGNLNLNGVGSKVNVSVAAPATASAGTTAALTAGAIVVATTAITAGSLVFFATNTLGTVTVPQAYRVSAITPGVSFTIQSQDATDTSTVNYWIIN